MTTDMRSRTTGLRLVRRLGSRTVVGLIAGHVAAAALLVGAYGWLAPQPASSRAVPTGRIQRSAEVERAHGIRLERIGMSADGGLIDLRYQTLDDHLASRIGQAVHVMIQDEASGTLLDTPAFGLHGGTHAHDSGGSALREPGGHRRYILFRNAAGTIRSGRVVTILVGDVAVRHVTVG